MEAEYVACYGATCQAIWLQNFISGLGIVNTIAMPLKIYCDNFAEVSFSKNNRISTRAKLIDIKYLFVKHKVSES